MANRRFELFEYRQVLVRMRQGDSDRDIARAGLMGRKKLTAVRRTAQDLGWLDPARPLPQDTVIAGQFGRTPHLPSTCVSTLEPFREQIGNWFEADVQGTTIHSALKRNHGCGASGFFGHRFGVKRVIQTGVVDVEES
ncbi:hypothetical protein B0G84_8883 [Paraburkholderia sp. BL8N3]|nr:hypothetical protein [Paraburkholderia sp. BL8N3]TCK31815.1 hypothetical protein B0G84_8883 [Paraburkholderia sp. BL8N3]